MTPERAKIASHMCTSRARLGRPSTSPFRCRSSSTSGSGFQATPFLPIPSSSTSGPRRRHLVEHRAVVALDDDELRHRLPGHRLALAVASSRAPSPSGCASSSGVSWSSGAATTSRAHAEVLRGQAAELLGDRLEDVQVGARLPRRRDRRVERVHERVQVRARDVVLLVPGRRRQDDVRVERGAVHPEVDRREEVELPGRRLVAPDDLARPELGPGLLVPDRRVLDAEQVAEEVLVALARRAEQVRPPEREHAREVPGCVRILGGEAQPPLLQLADDVVGGRRALGLGLVAEVERVAVERRVGRHPAQPARRARCSRRSACRRASRSRARSRTRRRASARSATGRSPGTRTASSPAGAAGGSSRARTPASPSR